jgi:hypothetical protein
MFCCYAQLPSHKIKETLMFLRPALFTLLVLLTQSAQAADRRDAPIVTRPELADTPALKSNMPTQLPPVKETEPKTDEDMPDTANPEGSEQERRTARQARAQQRQAAEAQRAEQRRQRHAQRNAQEQAEQQEADEMRQARQAQRNARLQREREEQAQRAQQRQARREARAAGENADESDEQASAAPLKTLPESARKAPKLPLGSAPVQTQDDEE